VDAAVCLGEFGTTGATFIDFVESLYLSFIMSRIVAPRVSIECNKLVIIYLVMKCVYNKTIIIYTYIKNKVYYYYYLLREQIKGKLKGKNHG
jgi:hypothetical protein